MCVKLSQIRDSHCSKIRQTETRSDIAKESPAIFQRRVMLQLRNAVSKSCIFWSEFRLFLTSAKQKYIKNILQEMFATARYGTFTTRAGTNHSY
jgi:hypothetical protein